MAVGKGAIKLLGAFSQMACSHDGGWQGQWDVGTSNHPPYHAPKDATVAVDVSIDEPVEDGGQAVPQNNPPVFNEIDDFAVTFGQTVQFQLSAQDENPASLVFSASSSSPGDPVNLFNVLSPGGFFEWAPLENFIGYE
ncbi:MAG: hypothetical protein HYU97_03955 [Deltaproteobacteria bacterium]|nr:hypothetical protein [Deltaproteobacteria bacterium]